MCSKTNMLYSICNRSYRRRALKCIFVDNHLNHAILTRSNICIPRVYVTEEAGMLIVMVRRQFGKIMFL